MANGRRFDNFDHCLETERDSGNSYASRLLRRAGSRIKHALNEGRGKLETYRHAGDEEAAERLAYLLERTEDIGVLDGSFEMTVEGAERIYRQVRDIVEKQSGKIQRGGKKVDYAGIFDALDPVKDRAIIATAMFTLIPEVRQHVRGNQEGLYRTVLNVGSNSRIGYTLETSRKSKHRPTLTNGMLPPQLKELLEAFPEPENDEEAELQRILKVLINKRAEREVLPLFREDHQTAFRTLDGLIANETNDNLREEYERLRDAYTGYFELPLVGVNPDFVHPKTGERNVLPSLYQRIGIYGIINHGRFGIWNGGGTGKTAIPILAQPILEEMMRKEGEKVGKTLILGPNLGRDAWEKGLNGERSERYLEEAQGAVIINGEQKTDEFMDRIKGAKWVFVNYDQLITEVPQTGRLFAEELADMGITLSVFDESDEVKGIKAQTQPSKQWPNGRLSQSGAARLIALRSENYVPMTATPISNGLNDFAVQYHMLNPGRCPDPRRFRELIEDSPRVLYTFFNEQSTRFTSEEVNYDLEWDERSVEVELDPLQREIYDHIVLFRPSNWPQQATKALLDPRLVHPKILKRVGAIGKVGIGNSAKFRALEELLVSDDGPIARGDNFVIFSSMLKEGITRPGNETLRRQYAAMGLEHEYERLNLDRTLTQVLEESMEERFGERIKIGIIDGSVKVDERKRRIAGLGSEYRGLLATIQTGGASLDFTEANWMMMLDRTYDPKDEDQAVWRELRNGQKKKVQIRHYEAVDSRDEDKAILVQRKRTIAKIGMDGHDPTDEEWAVLEDTKGDQLVEITKRRLGGRSINVYEAEIDSIDDFEVKRRITRQGKKRYGQGVYDFTTTDAQEVMRLIGQDPQGCWLDPEFVDLYMRTIQNLAPHAVHTAKISDLARRAREGDLTFPRKVLSEGSGPSLLYSAYQTLTPVLKAQGLRVPRIWDRDISQLMLDQGENPNQILGNMNGRDSTVKAGSFDMVDNESITLLSNPQEVYQTLLEANRVLRPEGLLELVVKNKRFLSPDKASNLDGFHSGLEQLGFEVLTERNDGFAVSSAMHRRLRDQHGEHFAESYAAKLANTYLLIARKQDKPADGVNPENFWFETIHPDDPSEDIMNVRDPDESRSIITPRSRRKGGRSRKGSRGKVVETDEFTHVSDAQGNVRSVRKGRK